MRFSWFYKLCSPGRSRLRGPYGRKPGRIRRLLFDRLEARNLLAVIAGDFNGDGVDDLAIGMPDEDVGTVQGAGLVKVIYGASGGGLSSTGSQIWHQRLPALTQNVT